MGLSGVNGKVYYADASCPSFSCVEGWDPPEDASQCLSDEVTRFNIVDKVNARKYAHSGSQGWLDSTAGARGLDITVDAVISGVNAGGVGGDEGIYAGRVIYLKLYPTGNTGVDPCGIPAEGWALVEQVSYGYDIETGNPNSYTATLSSKGPWNAVGGEGVLWGGLECACE
jgi:hypothetical protein